jgi:hypothetical protein
MSANQNQTDCPICMDVIEFSKNCVTTECGHCFHANCLMTSVAHNGFGCPYCRTAMAEEVQEEESVYSDENDYEEERFDDDALTSFRMFHQMINNEEVEEEPEIEEEEVDEEEEEQPAVPSVDFMTNKLKEYGITMEDLVKSLLGNHEEYTNTDMIENIDRTSSVIYGKMRIIINNFTRLPENDIDYSLPNYVA